MATIPRVVVLLTSALAMLMLGFTFGAMVGMSNTPVVGVALPLMFSVAGGASGLYLIKLDDQSPADAFRIVSLSVAIMAVSVGTLTGVWYGMSQRLPDIDSWSVVTSDENSKLRPSVTDDVLHKVLLDAKLVQLQLNRKERDLIFATLQEKQQSVDADFLEHSIVTMREAFETADPGSDAVEHYSEWEYVETSIAKLEFLLTLPRGDSINQAMSETLSNLDDEIGLLSDDDDDKQYLENNPVAAASIGSLSKETLKLQQALASALSWASLVEELDVGENFELPINSTGVGPSRSLAGDDIEPIPEA